MQATPHSSTHSAALMSCTAGRTDGAFFSTSSSTQSAPSRRQLKRKMLEKLALPPMQSRLLLRVAKTTTEKLVHAALNDPDRHLRRGTRARRAKGHRRV